MKLIIHHFGEKVNGYRGNMKNIFKQLLTESLQNTHDYSNNRDSYHLLSMMHDKEVNATIQTIDKIFTNNETTKSISQLAVDTINRYCGTHFDKWCSKSVESVIDQIIELSDVTSIYFDGSDIESTITSLKIKDTDVVALFNDLSDTCNKFRISAERVNEKCQNLATGKIKDLLEAEDQIKGDLQDGWNEIKRLANDINNRYSVLRKLLPYHLKHN